MKVDVLEIRSRFKNLEGVCIDFDQTNLMTVVVGRNGSGKSNVLEALVAIFRNLDLGDPPPFSYRLVYRLGTGDSTVWVSIDADPDRKPADQYDARHAPTLEALEAGGGKRSKKPASIARVTAGRSSCPNTCSPTTPGRATDLRIISVATARTSIGACSETKLIWPVT